jgi:F0F1-type ATP synthase membrane subunit b/b'
MTSVSLAKDRELAALARRTPSQIVEQAKSQSKQVAEDKKAQIQALTQLKKDLDTLLPE